MITERLTRSVTNRPRLLWLVSFPIETGAGWLLLDPSPLRVMGALVLHVVAAGVFGFSLVVREDNRSDWGWALLGWSLALLVFPLLGMIVVAVAFAATSTVLGRSKKVVDEIQGAVQPDGSTDDVLARAREMEVSLLEEREVEPVVDVLQEDDPELKRAAIQALTKQRNAETVRVLTGLLHDPSPEARLFASLALSRLEDDIGKSILSAQRALAANPNSPEARERLAHLYLDYTLSGFLEGAGRDYYLELARTAFEDALEVHPNPDRLIVPLARVHLMLGNIAEAAALLDDLARRRPNDAEVRMLRMAVIYEFGDFRELTVYARRMLPRFSGDAEVRELLEWWAQKVEKEPTDVV